MGRKSNYSEVYKREAVAKAQASGDVSQTARELGISNKSLHAWIKDYGEPLEVEDGTPFDHRFNILYGSKLVEALCASNRCARS